jgi:hypothetical protein
MLKAALLSLMFCIAHVATAQTSSLPSLSVPSLAWQQTNIPVCWENMGSKWQQEHLWVQNIVLDTWGKHTPLNFVGWGQCSASALGIRIRVDDTRPNSLIGRSLDGVPNGMHLNFDFKTFATECQNPTRKEICVKFVAAHEFGHAIGFLHEQYRADADPVCQDQTVEDPRWLQFAAQYGYPVGEYDTHTIMNYCSPDAYARIPTLTMGDIVGAAHIYGSKSDFLKCVVNGERNTSCCRYLTEPEKVGACTMGGDVPDHERVSFFKFCVASNGPRCCDHLTRDLARKYAPAICPL